MVLSKTCCCCNAGDCKNQVSMAAMARALAKAWEPKAGKATPQQAADYADLLQRLENIRSKGRRPNDDGDLAVCKTCFNYKRKNHKWRVPTVRKQRARPRALKACCCCGHSDQSQHVSINTLLSYMAKNWQAKPSHTEQEKADYDACVDRLNNLRALAQSAGGADVNAGEDLLACMSCYNYMRYHLKWGVPNTRRSKLSYVAPPDDGYSWSHRHREGAEPAHEQRQYYKCTVPGCPARKVLDRNPDDYHQVAITYYGGDHNHERPTEGNAGAELLDGLHGQWDEEDEALAHRTAEAVINIIQQAIQHVPEDDEAPSAEGVADDAEGEDDEFDSLTDDDDGEGNMSGVDDEDTEDELGPAERQGVKAAEAAPAPSSAPRNNPRPARAKAKQQVAAVAAAAAAAGWNDDASSDYEEEEEESDEVMDDEPVDEEEAMERRMLAIAAAAVKQSQVQAAQQAAGAVAAAAAAAAALGAGSAAAKPALVTSKAPKSGGGARKPLMTLPDDGHRWRYAKWPADAEGPQPLLYLECAHAGCPVKKSVHRSPEGSSEEHVISYTGGDHTHEAAHTAPVVKTYAKRINPGSEEGEAAPGGEQGLTWHQDVESWTLAAPSNIDTAVTHDDIKAARAARAIKRAKTAEDMSGDMEDDDAPGAAWDMSRGAGGRGGLALRACSCCGKMDAKPKYGIPALMRNLVVRWAEKAPTATALQKAEYEDLIQRLEATVARGARPGEGDTPGLCHTCYAHKRRALRWRHATGGRR